MSDDPDLSAADNVDRVGPWQIKKISFRAKGKALRFASDAGIGVGEWLERLIDAYEHGKNQSASQVLLDAETFGQWVDALNKLNESNLAPDIRSRMLAFARQRLAEQAIIQSARTRAVRAQDKALKALAQPAVQSDPAVAEAPPGGALARIDEGIPRIRGRLIPVTRDED